MEKRTAAMVVAALILAVTGCRETVTIGEDSQSPGGDVSLPRGDGASWEEVRLLPDLPRGEVASTVDVDGNADDAPYPPDVTEVTADLAGEVWTVENSRRCATSTGTEPLTWRCFIRRTGRGMCAPWKARYLLMGCRSGSAG